MRGRIGKLQDIRSVTTMELGAQLFTLRDYCKTIPDFAETLKKVADMGYRTVQVSGTCAFEADWLKTELEKNGLRCVLTHTAMDKIRDRTAQVIEEHRTFGAKYVGIGCAPNCFAKGDADWLELTGVIDAAVLIYFRTMMCFQRIEYFTARKKQQDSFYI